MTVSQTLQDIADNYGHTPFCHNSYDRMIEVCKEEFDFDNFLFEIWKETQTDARLVQKAWDAWYANNIAQLQELPQEWKTI